MISEDQQNHKRIKSEKKANEEGRKKEDNHNEK